MRPRRHVCAQSSKRRRVDRLKNWGIKSVRRYRTALTLTRTFFVQGAVVKGAQGDDGTFIALQKVVALHRTERCHVDLFVVLLLIKRPRAAKLLRAVDDHRGSRKENMGSDMSRTRGQSHGGHRARLNIESGYAEQSKVWDVGPRCCSRGRTEYYNSRSILYHQPV